MGSILVALEQFWHEMEKCSSKSLKRAKWPEALISHWWSFVSCYLENLQNHKKCELSVKGVYKLHVMVRREPGSRAVVVPRPVSAAELRLSSSFSYINNLVSVFPRQKRLPDSTLRTCSQNLHENVWLRSGL